MKKIRTKFSVTGQSIFKKCQFCSVKCSVCIYLKKYLRWTYIRKLIIGKMSLKTNHDWSRRKNTQEKMWFRAKRREYHCSRFGQACSRSLIVFSSQLFVMLLIVFGCFCKNLLFENFDWSTVRMGKFLYYKTSFSTLAKTMNNKVFTKIGPIKYWLDLTKQ